MRVSLCLVVLLLSACAVPGAHLDKNVTGGFANGYDGDWQAVMGDTPAVQNVADYRFDCAPFTEPFFMRVRDGVASGYLQADENFSFSTRVTGDGKFSVRIPTDSAYSYQHAEGARQSNIVLVLRGELSSLRRGTFVIGDEALDDKGCSTRVQFLAV